MRLLYLAIIILLLPVISQTTIFACTNFCMDTPQGPIFGCNLDFLIPADGLVFINQRGMAKQGLIANTKGAIAQWVSRYGSVSFNLAGREFAFGGMNEAGLVVASMELPDSKMPVPDERLPLTHGSWVQYVLDNCAGIEEIIELDAKVRIEDSSLPLHFLIADANGNCIAVEWLEGKFVCHYGDNLPVKAMTNTIYDDALSSCKRGGPHWWETGRGKSKKRFAIAAERNKNFDAKRDSNAVAYAFETLTDKVAAPYTRWNIVYDIAEKRVIFRSDKSPALKYLSLKDFDLSCKTPLLMMDVNSLVEGDVKNSFVPYDAEINTALFRTLCERYGLVVSEEVVAGIMNVVNSFECAH